MNNQSDVINAFDIKKPVTNRYLDLMRRYHAMQEEIAAVRRHEAGEVIACIVQMMAMYEICLDEIRDALPKQQRLGLRHKREPKYMDPETGKTWAGYGRPPQWMAGKNPNDFLLPIT